MPLAAPLILPFAQLAGITIAGLGMAAASEKVGDFISENPELSKQILITLVPGGAGLNTLFKKEAGITLEDLDEMTDEEAQDLSDEDIAGVMNEAGKTKGPGKRERMIEISRKLGLSGEGKERKKIIDDIDSRYDEGGVEDAPKPKFDYKKFFRNRNADGGAIGIEALFTDKKPRKNFSTGGDEQRKIADDEYYASLQNIIERDPGAKEFFNPDDITYPAMDKSGNYNYKGIQVGFKDLDRFKKYAEKRGLDQILSPESTFEEKIKEGQYPVGIFERPVETGTEPMDLRKMQTILHEARHKIMMKPEFRKIMDKYLLKEETFVRYLDKEFFPELDAYLPDFVNPEEADKTYKKAVEEYKDKFTKEDKGFINRLKNLFSDGGAIGIEVLFEEKKNGGRIGFANGGENIIGADLTDPETEFGLRPNTDDRMPLALAVMPEKVRNVFDVASDYNAAKGLTGDTSGGYLSNLRHGTAASQMRDALGGGVTGIIGANVLGLAQELPGLSLGAVNEARELFGGPKHSFMNTLNQTGEDIYANLYGSLYGKKGTTAETYADLADKFATDTGFINTALNATADKQNALNRSGLYQAISNYGTAKAADFQGGEMLQTPGVMVDANEGFTTPTRTNVQGRDLEADLGTRINPNIQPQQNIFQRAGNVFSSIKDNIPNFGIMGLLSSLDRFDTLSPEDQAFILDQAGGNRPSKDRYGINRRSAFGNYAQYVRDKGIFAPGKRGEYYRSISGLDQALMDTLDREQKAKAAYEKQIRDAADAASRNAARARSITAGYGGSDDSRGATGPTASGAGMGVGGGYASDYGFAKGGLATMFVEKR